MKPFILSNMFEWCAISKFSNAIALIENVQVKFTQDIKFIENS
jgi:hypothetical protein